MGHLGHVWDIPSGLWDGKDSGIWALYHGTLGTCLGYPKWTLGWEGQRDLGTLPWDTWDMSGISQVDSGMRRTAGFGHSTMGHLGHVWDIPSSPGTLGWDGQWDLDTPPWDT